MVRWYRKSEGENRLGDVQSRIGHREPLVKANERHGVSKAAMSVSAPRTKGRTSDHDGTIEPARDGASSPVCEVGSDTDESCTDPEECGKTRHGRTAAESHLAPCSAHAKPERGRSTRTVKGTTRRRALRTLRGIYAPSRYDAKRAAENEWTMPRVECREDMWQSTSVQRPIANRDRHTSVKGEGKRENRSSGLSETYH
jgi:hypothetical protein